MPSPSGEGHTWACDGSIVTTYYSGVTNTYKTFYGQIYSQTTYTSVETISFLHMNWGWESTSTGAPIDEVGNLLSSSNNGWYDCDTNYTQSGTASGDENFQYFQIVDYNIHP